MLEMADAELANFVVVQAPLIVCGVTIILGAIGLAIAYYINRNTESEDEDEKGQKLNENSANAARYKEISTETSAAGSSKRGKNKKRREAQQEFTHSWMVGALKGHTAPVLDMDYASNGKFLASCAEDRSVMIWCTKDLASKDRKSLRVNIEYDHASFIRWSPDSKAFIIHKAIANTVEVYKVTRKPDGFPASVTKAVEFPKQHDDDIIGMDIACNGRYIMTCSNTTQLLLWDLKGQLLSTLDTYLMSTHRARISPCGRFVVASGFAPDLKVWEVEFTKGGDFKQVSRAFELSGHNSGVYDFGFSADTSHVASVSKDGNFNLYDTKIEYKKGETPRILLTGSWHGGSNARLALSPNAEVIVIAHGSSVSFYSALTGELDLAIPDVFNGPITGLLFDALGEHVLVSGDKHIKIFHNVTGYKTAISSARDKLKQKISSATKERLEKTIVDSQKFLQEIAQR